MKLLIVHQLFQGFDLVIHDILGHFVGGFVPRARNIDRNGTRL